MAGVFIDIPGIGNVEAKNAATEATLKEILKVMKGQRGGGGGGGPGGGGGGGGSPGGAGGAGAGGGSGFFGKAGGAAGKVLGGLGKTAGVLAGGLGKLNTGAGFVTGKLVDLAEKGFKAADTLSKLDGSASSAADLFSGIPILGGIFKMVAGAADKMAKAYQDATASGASFGGSISQFSAAATSAGMNLAEFGQLIAKNGQGMLGFGQSTEEGAKRFAQVSKALRTTSSDLYALGYNTADINGGLARYGELLRLQGQQGGKSNAELAAGAKRYLVEMDQLAKITGEERSAKEAQMKQLATDAQFRMFLAGKDEKVGEDFRNMIGSFGPKLGGFVKDYMATGTLTTEANQKMAAMLGGDVMNEMSRLRQKLLNNQRLTDEEQDRLKSIMAKAAKANSANAGAALAASRDMDDASGGLIEAMSLTENAHKKSREAQEKSAKQGDGFNEKMEKMKQVLTGVSNTFTEILASSGFLDLMISGVKIIADLLMGVLAPAMKALDAALQPAIQFIGKILPPILATLGAVFEKVALGIQMGLKPIIDKMTETFSKLSFSGDSFKQTLEVIDTILDSAFGLFDASVRALTIAFDGAWAAVQGLIQPVQTLWSSLTDLWTTVMGTGDATEGFMGIILEVGDVVGQVFRMLGATVGWAIEKVTDIIKWFTSLINSSETVRNVLNYLGSAISDGWKLFRKYFSVEGFNSIFEGISDGFEAMIDAIMHLIPNAMGGMSDEVYEQRKKEREARAQARDTVVQAAVDERDQKVAEQKKAAVADKEEFAKKKVAVDTMKKLNDKELASREAAAKAAEKTIDYNSGPEELLKQFAGKEGSALLPKDQQAAAKAETTKKEIESQAEQKKAAEEKAKTESEAKKAAEEKAAEESKKKQGTQESAETLLAELNTKVGQLLKVNQDQKEINERQLTATKGMSKNLFA